MITDEIETYLTGLTATNTICSTLGTTFSSVYIGGEPPDVSPCVAILPYGGSAPSPEGDRQNPSVQIRLKHSNRQTALKTMQAIINDFHGNTNILNKGKLYAKQSSPIIFEVQQGGEYIVTISNYDIKHIKT
jgi:hypothetical protein